MDAILHTALGIAIATMVLMAFMLLGAVMAAGVFGAWDIYFREVTQQQAKYHAFDFRWGWNPADWSRSKNIETWIPVGVVLGVAAVIRFGVQ